MSELGILLMFTGWKLPAPVTDAVDYIGNCNTAFSMMAVGMILADINVKDFWDRTVAKFTFHRLVVIPAVVYGVCSFLPLDKNAFGICVLLAAMPAGATTSILAEKYGVTQNAIAVAWIMRHPAGIQTIVGSTNLKRIQDISRASDIVLSREEWYEIYLAAGKMLP